MTTRSIKAERSRDAAPAEWFGRRRRAEWGRRGRMAAVFLGLAALSVGAGALIARSMPEHARTLQGATPIAVRHEPAPYDLLATLDERLVAGLLAPEAPAAGRFVALPRLKASEVCALLASAGLVMEANATDAVAEHPLACVSGLTQVSDDGTLAPLADPGLDEEPRPASTLFATVQGTDGDDLSVLRIKVNALDPGSASAAREAAYQLVSRLYAALGWALPDAAEAIRTGLPADHESNGWHLKMLPEYTDARRQSTVLSVPSAPASLPVGRFDAAISAGLPPAGGSGYSSRQAADGKS